MQSKFWFYRIDYQITEDLINSTDVYMKNRIPLWGKIRSGNDIRLSCLHVWLSEFCSNLGVVGYAEGYAVFVRQNLSPR